MAVLRGLNWVLLAAGLVLVAGTIALEADLGLGVFAIPLVGLFIAFGFAAYIPFGVINRRTNRALPLSICALAMAGLSAFWIWGFGSTFWWNEHPDAQDGLVLVVMPAYMIVASGIVATGTWALDRFLASRGA